MNATIHEVVNLPDEAEQPLVHPLDLPEARADFQRALLVEVFASPPVGLMVAGIIAVVSGNYVATLIAGATLIGFGALASAFFRREAWAYIPRRRQDRERAIPLAWELGAAMVRGTVLALAILLIALRLGRSDVTGDVREFTFGMSVAVVALMLAEIGWMVGRSRLRTALLKVPAVVAVAASLAAAYSIVFRDGAPGVTPLTVDGAVTMLVAGAAVGAWTLLKRYREGDASEERRT